MQSDETHLPAWMDAWNHVRDLADKRGSRLILHRKDEATS